MALPTFAETMFRTSRTRYSAKDFLKIPLTRTPSISSSTMGQTAGTKPRGRSKAKASQSSGIEPSANDRGWKPLSLPSIVCVDSSEEDEMLLAAAEAMASGRADSLDNTFTR